MKKNILMAALVLLFVACGGNIKTEPINYDWSNTTTRTTSQMLHNDSVLIGKMICDIYKDHLFFYNDKRAADKHLSCFRLSGDSLVYKGQLLGIGKGPHEAVRLRRSSPIAPQPHSLSTPMTHIFMQRLLTQRLHKTASLK